MRNKTAHGGNEEKPQKN